MMARVDCLLSTWWSDTHVWRDNHLIWHSFISVIRQNRRWSQSWTFTFEKSKVWIRTCQFGCRHYCKWCMGQHQYKPILVKTLWQLVCCWLIIHSTDKQQWWKWTREFAYVSAVKKIESSYLQTVKVSKWLTLIKKELKRKKIARIKKLVELCKAHQGPLTSDSIHILKHLTEKELLYEICYLRTTTCTCVT